jgi:nucleotide-binding universal stress UspA family protein
VFVLHVIDENEVDSLESVFHQLFTTLSFTKEMKEAGLRTKSVKERLFEMSKKLMKQFIGERKSKNIHSEIKLGNPYKEIIKFAKDKKINLIIISEHKNPKLHEVLLGNVARKVVVSAPCPVLLIR